MADSDSQNPSLDEAASRFLAKLSPKKREVSQPEIHKFVRWYGRERPFARLTAHEVANYAKRLSLSATDYTKKLELVRAFLIYANNDGYSKTNLATHLKARKVKTEAPSPAKQGVPEAIPLTQQGYAELEAELNALKSKRPRLIDEIQKAAADKDFRENAPLAAAREQRGHLEGRIKELEKTLKAATIISGRQLSTAKIGIGDSLVLSDMTSGEELHYTIVNPKEINPTQGKISNTSPIGKAIIGRREGDIVETTVPIGKLRYRIKHIEH